jgi:hypothetical protein
VNTGSITAETIAAVDPGRIRRDVLYLAADPLPFRKLNYTVPGHARNSLYEADDYIQAQLEQAGYAVEREGIEVQAFRRDRKKALQHQYSKPDPADPRYTAYNLYARKVGSDVPDEIIVLVAHKDSQSWIDSPGANDNAVGTAGNLELARILAPVPTRRSIWFLWCNEEHTPWTSVTAAQNAKARGDNIIAVFNSDGLGRKSEAEMEAGVLRNVTGYTEPEGEAIADLMARVNERYGLGLQQSKIKRVAPGDDDGSYVKAGYPAAVINIGSFPYADPNYHTEGDKAETVDVRNAAVTVQAIAAAVLAIDADGAAGRE